LPSSAPHGQTDNADQALTAALEIGPAMMDGSLLLTVAMIVMMVVMMGGMIAAAVWAIVRRRRNRGN
jgi:hypothetical protein